MLKEMEMCIKESLRIFTTVSVFLRELATSLNLGSYYFFKNHRFAIKNIFILFTNLEDDNFSLGKRTLVFIAPGLIHRDPQIYPDPMTFDPDRFYQKTVKVVAYTSFYLLAMAHVIALVWKLHYVFML